MNGDPVWPFPSQGEASRQPLPIRPGEGTGDPRVDRLAGQEELKERQLTETLASVRGLTPREYRDAAQQGLLGRVAGDPWSRGTADRGGFADLAIREQAVAVARQARSEQDLRRLVRRQRASRTTSTDRDMRLFIDIAVRTYLAQRGVTDPDGAAPLSSSLFQEYLNQEQAADTVARQARVGQLAHQVEQDLESSGGVDRVFDLAAKTGFDPLYIAAFLRENDPSGLSRTMGWYYDRVLTLAAEHGLDPVFVNVFLAEYYAGQQQPFPGSQQQPFPGTIPIRSVPVLSSGLIAVSTAPLRPLAEFIHRNGELLKSLLPGSGIVEAVTGEDLVTGRKLAVWERVLGATLDLLDLLPAIGKAIGAGARGVRGLSGVARAVRASAAVESAATLWGRSLARMGLSAKQALGAVSKLGKVPSDDVAALLKRVTEARAAGRSLRLTEVDRKLLRPLADALQSVQGGARAPGARAGRKVPAGKPVPGKPVRPGKQATRRPAPAPRTGKGAAADAGFEAGRAALLAALGRAPVAASTLGRIGVASTRDAFRRALARKLKADPKHPLSLFLLENGKLRPSSGKGINEDEWLDMPEIVEAAHVASALSLKGAKTGTDRFMVMSAHHNRLLNSSIEGKGAGAWMELPHAIDIGGFPVHAESAVDWVAKGLLPADVLAAARPVTYP